MLTGGACRKRGAGVGRIGILQSLALADWIVGQDDEPVSGKQGGISVVPCLASGTVAGSHENGGVLAAGGRAIGDIEQSGNRKTGLAVEENFLDSKAVSLRGAKDSRIERSAFGQAADQRQNLLADLGLARFGLRACMDRGDVGGASRGVSGGNCIEILTETGTANLRRAAGVKLGSRDRSQAHRRHGSLSRGEDGEQNTGVDCAKN